MCIGVGVGVGVCGYVLYISGFQECGVIATR